MLWPDRVTIAGEDRPLADVLASVSIHHGRDDVTSEPQATTCQLVLQPVTREYVRGFDVLADLLLSVRDDLTGISTTRFNGLVTDAELADDSLTIIAAGRLSTLGRYPVGLVDYPAEPWSARVARAFAEAGLSALLDLEPDPEFDPVLVQRTAATAGASTLGDYLTFLAPMVGAAIADRTDGTVLVQALGSRTLEAPYDLDPADVQYSPAWEKVLPTGNVVTVRYTGDQSESVTLRDEASITRYDVERREVIDTTFADLADATTRAQKRLQAGAYARWNIREAPILRGLPLAIGQPVLLSSMPPASPYEPWTPLVEGWSETIDGEAWTMLLALSDPAFSGLATLPWQDVPDTGYAWNQIAPAAWHEAVTLADLTPLRKAA